MAKRNIRNKKAKKGGRPTDYKAAYNKQVEKLCKLGATDKEIADFFEVSESTINRWKKDYPKFYESIKKGKIEADIEVADKLYKKSIGYDIEEEHTNITEEIVAPRSQDQPISEFNTIEDAKTVKYKKTVTKIKKHIPADTTAQIFWLKNRQPKKWRDKQDIEHSGEIKTALTPEDLNKVKEETNQILEEIRKLNEY